MTYTLISKEDILKILNNLDKEIKFMENDINTLYVEPKEEHWKIHEELLLKMKERVLIHKIYLNTIDEEDEQILNTIVLSKR